MTVGIFSRESPDCYRWLVDFLQSFLPPGDVESLYIGNTSRIRPQDYTFSILYHSKTRGRINVTDVTDSLYDGELQALSRTLGKRNVIVVIDDLDNNSDEEKTQLLMSQPSIGMKAQELFLFTPEAKLKTDTNHVNISNKRRMKTIIEATRPSSLMNRNCTEVCRRQMRDIKLTIIASVLVGFGLVCWWYNFWVLQW
ncbi:uncharacterized protein ACMZJ9_010473 [Mantella aurantiaca]